MNEVTSLPRMAICLYGRSAEQVELIKQNCSSVFREHDINYFYNFNSSDSYQNLFTSVFEKRTFEITNSFEFDICMALNVNTDSEIYQYIKSEVLMKLLINPTKVKNIDYEILYYPLGGINFTKAMTIVNTDSFFASSLTFDLASNFSVGYKDLPNGRKSIEPKYDFYYFLKSLKIKTKCINYENSSLFKRTT